MKLNIKCNAENHDWVSTETCRKKCSDCGVQAYDHDYQKISSKVSGITDDERRDTTYQCRKCGHKAYVTDGYWNDTDSRESGYYLH